MIVIKEEEKVEKKRMRTITRDSAGLLTLEESHSLNAQKKK